MNPFDFVNSINFTKEDIMMDDLDEKAYAPFLVNRQLSYFNDTVMAANEMNVHSHLDNKLQYHFLLNITRKRKRFSKWFKPEQLDDMEAVKEYYGYSNARARQALSLLSQEEVEQIKSKVYRGGRN